MWQKLVKNHLTFLYLFCPKNGAIDFRKAFITQEWLFRESCPTPLWIAFLMLYRLMHNIRSHFNELILVWCANSIFVRKPSHILREHISKNKTWFNVKSSTYYLHMKRKILADFQICISVPLNTGFLKTFSNTLYGNFSFWKQTLDLLEYKNVHRKITTDFKSFFT